MDGSCAGDGLEADDLERGLASPLVNLCELACPLLLYCRTVGPEYQLLSRRSEFGKTGNG